MNKRHRQELILRVIRDQPIFTQEEIAERLKALGVSATQVTLSRDIRELHIVKTTDGYKELVREGLGIHLPSLLAEFLEDVRSAQNLIVLRTSSGHASSVAVALDNEQWPEVVGTIAGDDTVLVITPDVPTAQTVAGKLRKHIPKARSAG